ncbi:SHOCT domain-containing protein [Bacillus sp. V33-4]|uniref:SHOCT domain-containing protein n=1 Tax=Bacillus sp. V33-4 TaxID=2054169 RepID=UPI000C7871BB|nr:SHOCT domain-containing protein [Bacillus sp. V33-4]PLR83677.1 hypothetical protein CVD23_13675 [Bacillus sp. V33-4]
MMGPGYGFGGYGMGGGSSMMLLGFVVIGILIYMLMKKQNTGNGSYHLPQKAANSEAIEIAKSRLASGEISVEEFEQIKKNLL